MTRGPKPYFWVPKRSSGDLTCEGGRDGGGGLVTAGPLGTAVEATGANAPPGCGSGAAGWVEVTGWATGSGATEAPGRTDGWTGSTEGAAAAAGRALAESTAGVTGDAWFARSTRNATGAATSTASTAAISAAGRGRREGGWVR